MRESGERGVVGGRGEGRGGAEGKEKGRSWVEDSKLASFNFPLRREGSARLIGREGDWRIKTKSKDVSGGEH